MAESQHYDNANGMDTHSDQLQRQAMMPDASYEEEDAFEDYSNNPEIDQLNQGRIVGEYPVETSDGFSTSQQLQSNANGNPGQAQAETSAEELLAGGFVSAGRMRDRHVPPRDFPHPHPNLSSKDEGDYSGSSPGPGNDLVIPSPYPFGDPSYPPNLLRTLSSSPGRRARVDPNLIIDIGLPPSIRQQARLQAISSGSGNKAPRANAGEAGKGQQPLSWCEEHHRDGGPSMVISERGGELWEFGVVGYVVDTFFPKPGDILILANERQGCPWPAFDGHLEIYVDEDYFTKSSVALQWNYSFNDGDLVLRFGDFDRHWRWRPSDQVHVFLRDNGAFFLVSRQQAQELHPLDFKFVDPRQRKVHSIQYHFRPRIGDFVLRKRSDDDDSYLWDPSWWHPGGDSHLLLKHSKGLGVRRTYPQGPPPKYRWTFHWYRRGVSKDGPNQPSPPSPSLALLPVYGLYYGDVLSYFIIKHNHDN